jgi:flagella basal body P-ring formation protein FlgA
MPARSQIAIYRAPDLGTTGTMPVWLRRSRRASGDRRRHRAIREISSRGRPPIRKRHRGRRPRAAAHRTASATPPTSPHLRRDAGISAEPPTGAAAVAHQRFDPRNAASTSTFEIANEARPWRDKLRFHRHRDRDRRSRVLARGVERNEVIKSSDVVIERRPRPRSAATSPPRRAVGMQASTQLRAAGALRTPISPGRSGAADQPSC